MSDSIPFNTAPFVKVSIDKVIQTLIEAMVLVFCVMFLFLQNIRYTFIPAIAAPIALLGTFSIMLVTGFSINVLTIFGMVLAIGIIVDNAIVVVENVERLMSEKGLSPQADASARMQIDDVLQLYVRNSNGGMVALSEFVTPSWRETSPQFIRFQGYPALLMSGSAASGVSSGEAMAEVERLAKQLPPGFTMVWTGQSLQERQSASLAPMLMTMSSSRQRTRTSNDDGTSTQ